MIRVSYLPSFLLPVHCKQCRVGTTYGQFRKAFRVSPKRVSGIAGGGKRFSWSLSSTEHHSPCRQAREPSPYISPPIPLTTTPSSSLLLAFCFCPPTTPLPQPQRPSLSSQDITVATIRHDKGSDIPTNTSDGGTMTAIGETVLWVHVSLGLSFSLTC